MTNNIGLDFFKDSENFLTELSDLESEYVSGGGKWGYRKYHGKGKHGKGKHGKGSSSISKSYSYSY